MRTAWASQVQEGRRWPGARLVVRAPSLWHACVIRALKAGSLSPIRSQGLEFFPGDHCLPIKPVGQSLGKVGTRIQGERTTDGREACGQWAASCARQIAGPQPGFITRAQAGTGWDEVELEQEGTGAQSWGPPATTFHSSTLSSNLPWAPDWAAAETRVEQTVPTRAIVCHL